ncbi:Sister chromatid cohesion protein SCC2 [Camellia lanceoleosa]|uniref:Sister chromatid cohesion protein SCC2 n=1 Tax=Camellia lanceoleosa TaxID=1840588 RepID=A0ACC0HEE0_9ERIC|nr:Sister chromatid cohesion protein SCC2 [Camellia lanceoleosa]
MDSPSTKLDLQTELVVRHIASHPDVGLKYFEKVAERIKDTGVSVRKRAIKIIREMCTSNANFSEFTRACIEIISPIFYEFWFEEPSGLQTRLFGGSSSVPLELAKKTEQIVEMLRRMPNHQLLVEEMNNDEEDVHTLPFVLLLHAFCVVDPTLYAPASDLSQFVVTLQPYLKSQMQALQNIYEYLLDAESQMATDNNSNNVVNYSVDGGHSVPIAAGAGDTNICGGIVQLYWDNILGRCLDLNEQVHQSAMKIVEIVLRQGLVHPTTCVPYLIALETGPEEANSMLAHHLLMNMNEKYLAFCESCLGDGLQMSFIFIRSMVEVLKIQTLKSNSRYCTEILALFPFTLPDELLYLIYAMNRSYTSYSRHTISMDLNGTFKEEPADEPVSNHSVSVDSNLRSRSPCNSRGISEDDLQKIQADCLSTIALQLLLKLKRHLKIVYGLNDTRCQEFSPNEPLKLGEALPKQNIPFNTNETHIDLPINHQEVLQRYQRTSKGDGLLRGEGGGLGVVQAGMMKNDDDEDWRGSKSGGRRLNNSGRKSNSSRGRQWS